MVLFKSKQIDVDRFPVSAYVNGRWTEADGEPLKFTVQGNVQPDSGKQLIGLVEGKRIHEVILIITDSVLHPANPKTGKAGDVVYPEGRLGPGYEIMMEQNWKDSVLPHYEYLAICEKEIPADS